MDDSKFSCYLAGRAPRQILTIEAICDAHNRLLLQRRNLEFHVCRWCQVCSMITTAAADNNFSIFRSSSVRCTPLG